MRLSRCIEGIDITARLAFRDVEVTGVAADTRMLKPGDCFIATRGHSADGHVFIPQAIGKGASALVVERPGAYGIPTIVVEDSASAAWRIAKRFYGDPAAALLLAGVTGTNGKTSTAFLFRSIMNSARGPCGIIGTVGYGASGALRSAGNTTPGGVDLYRMLAEFVARGCRSAVMEVSSHAADQGRIAGLEFDVGAFTNLTRDHLDYHMTLESYRDAKEKFIKTLAAPERVKGPGTFVYNADDAEVVRVAERFGGRRLSFAVASPAHVRAEHLTADLTGTRFDLVIGAKRAPLTLKLLGTFSAYNALAAAASAHAAGIGIEEIRAGLEKVGEVPGRFQVVARGRGPTVVVDYAHTPDALEKLLNFCRELAPRMIVTVFGCGGDRDRGKRPLMAAIAARLSNIIYVTDDNPRTEDPERIVRETLEGVKQSATPVHVVRDRRSAIREAIAAARGGDIVVIAGKGHESEQLYGDSRIPFSDAREAEEALEALEVGHQS